MRWEDERYVRIFTRDTAEWIALGWEAQSLFVAILRKVDRAGILTLGKTGARGLAGVVRFPVEVVERALSILIEDGCIKQGDGALVVPNFILAQETPQSDKARQREKRERDRTRVMGEADVTIRDVESQNVTGSHAPSRAITPSHSVPSRAEPCLAVLGTHTAPAEATEAEAALRSHKVILAAADGAPVGPDAAITALAEVVDGKRLAKGSPWPWVELAIADAARDLGAEASGVGRLSWTTVATKVARYVSNAKKPRAAAQEPSEKGGREEPLGDDELWVSERWREARRRSGLPDGEPDRKHVAALWAKSSSASASAKPVAGWKPPPREIVAFWIKSYLADKQERAGGIVDQKYPLALLVSRAGETYGLPRKQAPQSKAPPSAPAPEPVRAPPSADVRRLIQGAMDKMGAPPASAERVPESRP